MSYSPSNDLDLDQSPDQPPSPALERGARIALGQNSPQKVWSEVATLVAQAWEYEEAKALRLVEKYQCPLDRQLLQEDLEKFDPVDGVNQLVYSNPDMDLSGDLIRRLKPLQALEAVLKMEVLNDRLQ